MPLTEAWFDLRPHELQQQAWRSKARFLALACGRGSGKSLLSHRRAVRYLCVAKPWSDPRYFYAWPTREQARRNSWEKLQALVPSSWLAKRNAISHSDLSISTEFGSRLWLVGMDKPQRIEGDQWDGGILDESCDQRPRSFALSVRPALSHRTGWCWRIGVPKRFGIGAAEFKDFFESCKKLDDHESYTWPSWEIMTPEEIEAARRDLDARDFDEQYGASWQSVAGLIFYAFDEPLDVSPKAVYDAKQPIIVGSDFNVDPMAWVLMHANDKGGFDVFDEIWLRNTNTQQTLDKLFEQYGKHDSGWLFFGDATGRARSTKASASDYAQIRTDTRFSKARVFYPKANPARADRFAACNALFCNAASERRVRVHPRCKNLIRDLTTRAYAEGTREPDDYGDVGHITDAFGYPVHFLKPIGAPKVAGTSRVMTQS